MSNSELLVSVVVPIYNVVDYLEECFRSLVAQSLESIEIIMVDDGSTDGSGALADNLAATDDRATAIHKNNGGLSSARNAGIARALGAYIVCVDSDDVISPVYIEALVAVAEAEKADMAVVRHGFKFHDGDTLHFEDNVNVAREYDVLSSEEYQRELLYQKSDNGSVYRIYRTELARSCPFPEGKIYEDLATTYKMAHRCQTVPVLRSTRLYAYRLRRTGILRSPFVDAKLVSCFEITRGLYRDIQTWYPSLATAVHSRCFSVNRVVFSQIPASNPAQLDASWKELCLYRNVVLHDKSARKRERVAALIACMGKRAFRLFCSMYPAIQKMLRQQ